MNTKLTILVPENDLAVAKRKLRKRDRTISEAVRDLIKRIADGKDAAAERKGWIEQFGDLKVPLNMREAESDSWYGKHLRRTDAYKRAKSAQRKRAK